MILDSWIINKINLKTMNRDEIDRYQINKFNELIHYTKDKSTFYKDLYKNISGINSIEDIKKLPLINENDILKNGNKMVCVSQSDISRVVSLDTSGTTGKSKRIYFTPKDQDLTVDFFHYGMNLVVRPKDNMLVMMPYEKSGSVGDLIKAGLNRLGVTPIMNGLISSFKESIKLIDENEVNSIVGPPIQVLALAKYTRLINKKLNIRSVLLSSDGLSEIVVREIENIWSCKVFNHYGMTEMGLGGAIECNYHNGMHIRENDLFIEIVNPNTKEAVKDGEFGEIVITTLTREAMPLIRYCTGDISRIVPGVCSCKSSLKRLDNIRGRIKKNVSIGKNKFINITEIDELLLDIPYLMDFKAEVEYKGEDKIILNLEITSIENDIDVTDIENLLKSIESIERAIKEDGLSLNINVETYFDWVCINKGKRKINLKV